MRKGRKSASNLDAVKQQTSKRMSFSFPPLIKSPHCGFCGPRCLTNQKKSSKPAHAHGFASFFFQERKKCCCCLFPFPILNRASYSFLCPRELRLMDHTTSYVLVSSVRLGKIGGKIKKGSNKSIDIHARLLLRRNPDFQGTDSTGSEACRCGQEYLRWTLYTTVGRRQYIPVELHVPGPRVTVTHSNGIKTESVRQDVGRADSFKIAFRSGL